MVEATDMAISTVQRVGMELRPILLEQFGRIAALIGKPKSSNVTPEFIAG